MSSCTELFFNDTTLALFLFFALAFRALELVLTLRFLLQKCHHWRQLALVASADAMKAFDRMQRHHLLTALEDNALPLDALLVFFAESFRARRDRLENGGHASQFPDKVKNGIRGQTTHDAFHEHHKNNNEYHKKSNATQHKNQTISK